MTSIPKNPRVKSLSFLKWTRKQLDVINFQYGCVAHHIKTKTIGGMGFKADDYLVMPLLPKNHDYESPIGIHRNINKWEKKNKPQAFHIKQNLENAYNEGVINHDIWLKYTEICEELINKRRGLM